MSRRCRLGWHHDALRPLPSTWRDGRMHGGARACDRCGSWWSERRERAMAKRAAAGTLALAVCLGGGLLVLGWPW